jgi:hypothetical protein
MIELEMDRGLRDVATAVYRSIGRDRFVTGRTSQ